MRPGEGIAGKGHDRAENAHARENVGGNPSRHVLRQPAKRNALQRPEKALIPSLSRCTHPTPRHQDEIAEKYPRLSRQTA